MLRKLKRKTRKYCRKRLIPTCLVVHKILSKKHAFISIIQQIQILRIRNGAYLFEHIKLINSKTT